MQRGKKVVGIRGPAHRKIIASSLLFSQGEGHRMPHPDLLPWRGRT